MYNSVVYSLKVPFSFRYFQKEFLLTSHRSPFRSTLLTIKITKGFRNSKETETILLLAERIHEYASRRWDSSRSFISEMSINRNIGRGISGKERI